MEDIKDIFLKEYAQSIAQSTLLPLAIVEDYEVCACLKASEDRETYLLRSKAQGQEYILKRTSPSCKEDVESEYHLLTSLSHLGLPRAVQFFKQDECGFLIREYFSGTTLADLIEKKGKLSPDESVKIMLQICDILRYLHTQNPPVIHRDIKPQNIIYTTDGKCKIIDLGISRRYRSGDTKDTLFMGTEATAAPEQFGYRQTDVRSDIYSLGVLLLFLLTGSLDVQKLHTYEIPNTLKKIITRCVRFSPDDRFSSIGQLQFKLEHFRPIKIPILSYISVFLTGLLIGALTFNTLPESAKSVSKDIAFSSPLIEKAVRIELGKTDGESITNTDLLSVTELLICGETVYSSWNEHRMYGAAHQLNGVPVEQQGSITVLDDLSRMKNLRELALYNQRIEDLTPLKSLKLTRLGLGGNSIRDISLLNECEYIITLNIADNPITDITPLRDLTSIGELDISCTSIDDITPISELSIDILSLLDTPLKDYSPLTQLTSLKSLRSRMLSQQGLDIVTKLTFLRQLTLYNSGIRDLRIFSTLEKLDMLDVYSNEIQSLDGIENLVHLVHLGVGQNTISDLSPLIKLSNLESIDLNNAKVANYAPLTQMPHLKRVYCDKSQALEVEAIRGNAEFNVFIQE